jgi:hypothetical protein
MSVVVIVRFPSDGLSADPVISVLQAVDAPGTFWT